MSRVLSLFAVGLLMISVGCGKSDTKSPTASNNSNSNKPGPVIIDPAVEQATATVAAPAEKSAAEATQAIATEKTEKAEDKLPGVGDKAPAWEGLTGTDDKQHSLKDLEKAKAVAVIFTCNTCPVAQAYEKRIAELSDKYKDTVAVVAINVNKGKANDLEAMKNRTEKEGLTYAYLCDPSQKIGRDYGATTTPHVFLLDQERKIAYTGAIDDNMNADAVKKHSLQAAIDDVLAGKAPAVAETKPAGCGIRYE